MERALTLKDDGSIDGYLTIDEFAKKHFVAKATVRSRIGEDRINYIAIKTGPKRWTYLVKDDETITLYDGLKREYRSQ